MWIAGRLAGTLAMLLVVSALLFALTRATPLSPARIVLGADATDAQITGFEHDHGLDRPVLAQFVTWLGALPQDGFGKSFITGVSIDTQIAQSFPVTLELVVVAFAMAVTGALLLGVTAALTEDGLADHVIRLVAISALSVPGFWLALVLIRVFAVRLGWFPPMGIAPLTAGLSAHTASLLLPALSIAFYYMGALSRLMRASLIDVLGQDHTRTSRSLGLRRHLALAYAIKCALPPVVSVAAMAFGYMFGWAIIVELVFNIPGLSRTLLTAVTQRDYPMIQAAVLVITVIFVLANMLSDMVQRLLNPRLAA